MLNQTRLRRLLDYDPSTGLFTRKVARGGLACGAIAGHISADGYLLIRVRGVEHFAHRLAWMWMTDAWPEYEIDHRNGVRNDNRWSNLREATHRENAQNKTLYRNNTSGFCGVRCSDGNKWTSRIGHCGENIHLGSFDTPEEAHAAYLNAKSYLHTFQPVPRDHELPKPLRIGEGRTAWREEEIVAWIEARSEAR